MGPHGKAGPRGSLPSRILFKTAPLVLLVALVGCSSLRASTESQTTVSATTTLPPPTAAPQTTPPTTTQPLHPFADRRGVGEPAGTVAGLLSFRGNPSRSWYGTGPVPNQPEVAWQSGKMCGASSVGGETKQWCGTGWTGQPAVWERTDGVTEVVFGAYDHAVHFHDVATGEATREPFPVGDLIKGSVTIDPDGYPLLYFGSRDNQLRVLALDREPAEQLWALDSTEFPGKWNNDWDGNPLVMRDLLFEGGENGIFFVVKLNRDYDSEGKVVVSPEILLQQPSWNEALTASLPERKNDVGIENSVAMYEGTVYFANSGGRVLGIDISQVENGEAPIVFDYWVGDDVDASLVIDAEGALYVAVEQERFTTRSDELGQLLKLDPQQPDEPLVWGVKVPPRIPGDGGLWATPALGKGMIYAATHPGELLAVDAATGEVTWRDEIGFHAWSSPVIIDDTLVAAVECENGGGLRAYSLENPRQPVRIWDFAFQTGCIESTPAIWKGTILVGSRDGYFYALR